MNYHSYMNNVINIEHFQDEKVICDVKELDEAPEEPEEIILFTDKE